MGRFLVDESNSVFIYLFLLLAPYYLLVLSDLVTLLFTIGPFIIYMSLLELYSLKFTFTLVDMAELLRAEIAFYYLEGVSVGDAVFLLYF